MNKGIILAISSYVLWGLLPVYWKTLKSVPALEILCHRMVWSFVFVLIVLGVRKHWKWLRNILKKPISIVPFLSTACILGTNCLTYIWAVNSGYIVEASLGYFINPLISVLLGVLFLSERLRSGQWTAVFIAACGVFYLTAVYGAFPWISLTLALTFGFYSLLRKTASLSALEGLLIETVILSFPSIFYLFYLESDSIGSFGHAGMQINILLALTGVVTALPLVLFTSAARKINLTTIGILQYIAPILQFLLGVFVYGEIFTKARLIGFCMIWISLSVYSVEGIIVKRKRIVVDYKER